MALTFHDIFHGTVETGVVSSVVDGLAIWCRLAHEDGSTVRALMGRSALRRADDAIALATFQDLTEELWADEHWSLPKSDASCSTWRSASRARNSR